MFPKPEPTKKLGVFPQDKPINPDRLYEELKTALGEKLLALDTGQMKFMPKMDAGGSPVLDENKQPVIEEAGPFIHITVSGEATADDLAAAEQLLKAHDPANLSVRQQREKEAIDAYARLGATDFAAIRKLDAAGQLAAILDLMEDWQRLMVAARG